VFVPRQKAHGVQGELKRRRGANETAALVFHFPVPVELHGDELVLAYREVRVAPPRLDKPQVVELNGL